MNFRIYFLNLTESSNFLLLFCFIALLLRISDSILFVLWIGGDSLDSFYSVKREGKL